VTTAPEYEVSTDKARLDVALIHRWLSESSYWAKGRGRDTVVRSIENSLCFGAYARDGSQAGFARVVTDLATFAWICDVFVVDAHRGRGVGKRLIEEVVAHPQLQGLRRLLLATADAHELYRRYGGFAPLRVPESWMERFEGSSGPAPPET
jgi:GNAT superfamily N-acetyltransferase